MYACGNCGAPVAYGQTSCSACGVPIDWGQSSYETTDQYEYEQQVYQPPWDQQTQYTANQQDYIQQTYQDQQTTAPLKKRKPGTSAGVSPQKIIASIRKIPLNIGIPLLIICVLLILGGIIIAGILDENANESNTAASTGKPVVSTFTADPSSIVAGQTTTLSWNVKGATTISIDQGIGTVPASGTHSVSPTKSTTYTMTATANNQSATATVDINITAMGSASVVSFTVTPNIINAGQPATLQWNTSGATSISIDNGIGEVASSGTQTVYPSVTTTYKLTVSNSAGSNSTSATITVNSTNKPVISSFTASPNTIASGGSSTLQWNVNGATSVSIDNGVENVPPAGTQLVSPTATTTYTLTATNSFGSTTASVTIALEALKPPVITSFTGNPSVINAGEQASFVWEITGATVLSIDNGVGDVTNRTPLIVPSETKTYTITATNSAGSTSASTIITVNPAGSPIISSFTASPSNIIAGQSSMLRWDVINAASVSIDQDIGTVTSTGAQAVSPTTSTTYKLTATNSHGSASSQVTVNITTATAGLPVISSFIANPPTVSPGGSTLLSWQIQGDVTTLYIDQGVGTPSTYGQTVTPTKRTTYTLTVTNSAGSNSASVMVDVQ
jgi:hypothetical protein